MRLKDAKTITIANKSVALIRIGGKVAWKKKDEENLIPKSVLATSPVTMSGVTFTPNGDGSYTLSGTPTVFPVNANLAGKYSSNTSLFILPAGTYTANVRIRGYNVGHPETVKSITPTGIYNTPFGTFGTITLTEDFEVTWVTFPQYTDRTYNNDIYVPTIKKG